MSMMSTSRRSLLAGMGAAALLATMASPARAQSAANNSLSALWQDMELVDGRDDSFTIKDSRKPLTLVKLWAAWCPVCISELSRLDELVAAVGPQNLDVILISHPSWFEADQQAAQNRGVRYRLATPSRANGQGRITTALMDGHGMYAVPRSLVFGKGGEEVVVAHQGAMNWTDATMVAQLRSAALA